MSALTGCTAQQAESAAASTTTATDASQQAATDATYVQVQSIDNGTVTAVSGTLAQNTPPSGGVNGQQDSAPQQPSGDSANQPQGTPPSGDSANGAQGSVPQQPSGDNANGQQGNPPSGSMPGGMGGFTAGTETVTFTVDSATVITLADGTAGTIDSIAVGDVLAITLSSANVAETIAVQSVSATPQDMNANGQPGANFGGSAEVTNGTSATTLSEDATVTGETYTSSGDDENALRIDGAAVTLDGITVNKAAGSSSSTENGDFYGMNAGLLAQNGATVTITGANVTTNAVNGNGVFSYGSGTTVYVSDSVIRTSQNNSGGIQTTGGATMNATNLDVQTEGGSSAAIRSDRGGGDVNVSGGTYVTNGTGSPAVYSTADITVENAALTANNSEAIVVEGKNSVTLNNVTLSGNMPASTDANENIHNIMLYQSMSGDAEVGQSSFTATGGSILANAGDMFYVTNTTCAITLSSVALTLANDTLLNVCGNSNSRGWGTAGANGGTCVFTVSGQMMNGNILVDAISSLDFSMLSGSVFTGAINPSGAAGTANVTIEDGCQWILTGDCYITSFTGSVDNIVTNGYTVYVNGVAITG
ncbi:MAG TPA: hypothetical protein VN417_03725 [Candidatus Cryosericum sp.]|nr:hypothetical protein [Candidatus Cryosericum sp.]